MKVVKHDFDNNRFCIDDVLDVIKARKKLLKQRSKAKNKKDNITKG